MRKGELKSILNVRHKKANFTLEKLFLLKAVGNAISEY
jgi:hypothetical protein